MNLGNAPVANALGKMQTEPLLPEAAHPYDPFAPISPHLGRHADRKAVTRSLQRLRRSEILATIRRLLTERGCEHVTMRGLAEASGYAVQTIYNLVGPRNQAISEAISEYSLYVGRTASPRPEDPRALFSIISSWLDAIEAEPEFCRQTNLIFFTPSRSIYYKFRDQQLKGMRNLLRRQQTSGIFRPGIDVDSLAEHLVLLSSALWLEWSDRPFSIADLQFKLFSGFSNLLLDKVADDYRPLIEGWVQSSRGGQ